VANRSPRGPVINKLREYATQLETLENKRAAERHAEAKRILSAGGRDDSRRIIANLDRKFFVAYVRDYGSDVYTRVCWQDEVQNVPGQVVSAAMTRSCRKDADGGIAKPEAPWSASAAISCSSENACERR